MGLPINLNPCENIKSEIDEKIHALEQQSVILRSKIAKLRNEIMGYVSPPSPVHTVDGAIGAITADSFDAGATAYTQISNFAGTCADSVFNGVREYAAALEAFNNDKLGSITELIALPESNALGAYRDYKSALGTSAVSTLLADIDEKLGCLADNSEIGECLELFDWFNSRVEDLLKYMGLSESGALDLFTFATQFNINIPNQTEVFQNINSLDVHLDTVNTEIEGNIATVGEGSVVTDPATGKTKSDIKPWY